MVLSGNNDVRHNQYSMTFHKIFWNYHEKYALDCGTLTDLVLEYNWITVCR